MPLGSRSASLDQNIHELIGAPSIERDRIGETLLDALRLRRRKVRAHTVAEFLHQQRHALGAPPPMADRIVDLHALGGGAIPEKDLDRIADVALVALVIGA